MNRHLDEILVSCGPAVRPHYTWCLLHAARMAKHLGVARISAIEFGVANGQGLRAMERAATEATARYGVAIDVYGFDTGAGLPRPESPQDLPNLWSEGFYKMDAERVRASLDSAQLILGDVAETLAGFVESAPAPVGFVAIDLDYHSSTVSALRLLEAPFDRLLPRVHCYFDDVLGPPFGEHNGERLAIKEFNEASKTRKLDFIHGLRWFVPFSQRDSHWPETIWLAHLFEHPKYAENDGIETTAVIPYAEE